MTTIAYRDGVMAADSRCSDDTTHTFLTKTHKIFRLNNKALLGLAGEADCRDLIAVMDKCSLKKLPTKNELANTKTEATGILAWPNGKVFALEVHKVEDKEGEWSGGLFEVEERFFAVGTGQELALGAMAAGKGAVDAVAIACRYDNNSSPPIRQEMFIKQKEKANG